MMEQTGKEASTVGTKGKNPEICPILGSFLLPAIESDYSQANSRVKGSTSVSTAQGYVRKQ
jgi:hypothetical protein